MSPEESSGSSETLATEHVEFLWRASAWFGRIIVVIGIAVFFTAGFNGKFIGLGLALYGSLERRIADLAQTNWESTNRIERKLAAIESLLSKRISN